MRKQIKLIIIWTRNAPEDARRFDDRCSGVGPSEHDDRSPPRFENHRLAEGVTRNEKYRLWYKLAV